MANYCCTIRTNYFHVKNELEFRSLMEQVYGSEDTIEVWEKRDDGGSTMFGFGCYGGIAGIRDTDEDDDLEETAFDRFLENCSSVLQRMMPSLSWRQETKRCVTSSVAR